MKHIVPGSRIANALTEVLSFDNGPQTVAFFDLDRTLIQGFSAKDFIQNRLLSGKMKPREVVAQFSAALVYAIGDKNFGGLATLGAKGVKGIEESVFIELGEQVYLDCLADEIYPESRALVAAHLSKGHIVVIVSAATPYQIVPIAHDLGIEHILCTKLEIKGGQFTGNIIDPPCWGEGKAQHASAFADKFNIDLSKAFFYTDSAEDLPLLEIVGHPRPVNPDVELSSIAFKNNWPVFHFCNKTRLGVSNIIRTILTIGSFIAGAISGLVAGILSLSMRNGVNSMLSIIGDLGVKAAGIQMAVKDEEYLWSHRPAVFILNHQSGADILIVAKLIKKDAVGIAKKELRNTPIGLILMAADTIFIDRSNPDKAIEAMQPAVDALQNGLSVVIAPEGTRSHTYRLGPFKKGAFHLAMQAGVPIVPIVVKNSSDVLPKGKKLVRPAKVEIVVLKPVSVKNWKLETLDSHIAELRKKYLKELHQ